MSEISSLVVGENVEIVSGFAFPSEYFDQERGTPLIRIRDISNAKTEVFYTGPILDHYTIKSGDILIGMDGEFKAFRWKGHCALLNQRVLTIRKKSGGLIDLDFLFYWIGSELKRIENQTSATTVKHLASKDVARLVMIERGLPTQRRIAAVLRTVDEVIEATEARIEKQQAIKQGLLHDLFTRGVTPDGQLRPPPTERPDLYQENELGLIPKEWEVLSFGKLIRLSAFGPRFPADAYDDEGNVALLTTTDMDDDGNVEPGELTRARLLESAFAYHFLEENDLLISRSGTIGVAALFSDSILPTLPGAFLIRFRFFDPMIAPFFRRYFNHPIGRQRLRGLAGGGVLQNLKGSAVMQLTVAVPSETEITQVSGLVEAKFAEIETDKTALNKLRQLKSALMQDLLTGRVSADAIDLEDLLPE